jgi:hypothetical protein
MKLELYMAKSIRHKLEAKFRQGLLDYEKAPDFLQNKWARKNFSWGKFRKLRLAKKLKDLDKDL